MLLMIPGTFSLVRDWVQTNIIAQLLSWNAATVAFVQHFQRSDYREGRHALYTAAKQSPDESTQVFSRRFQTLVMQLRIADNDRMCIETYIDKLPGWLQIRLAQAKTHIRMHSNPLNIAWDWTSLSDTISRAILIASEKRVQKQTTEEIPLPLHLRSSILANPSSMNGGADAGGNKKRKTPPNDKSDHKEKEKKVKEQSKEKDKEPKKCIHHPTSTTHTTAQCINKGKTHAQTRAAAATVETEEKKHKPTTAAPSFSPQTRQRTGVPIDMTKIQCHNCHRFGHMSRTCTFSAPRGGGVTSTSSSSTIIPSRGGQASGRRPTIAQARMVRAEALRPHVSFADEQEQQEQDESEDLEEERHTFPSSGRGTR